MLTYDDLVNDLQQGCKPRASWRIGIEHERFAFEISSGAPLSYQGQPGIEALLTHFAAENGWTPISENGHVIALAKDGCNLTLEPGGQVEFSGSPCPTLGSAKVEMENFHRALDDCAAGLGIGFLARGVHPDWRREDIKLMPKPRYDIMAAYMPLKGDHGLDMMLRTAGAQVNLDFESEADMIKKYRVALAVQPVITALMANSRMVEGQASGFASFRAHIWTDTDADRCGIPEFVFGPEMSFARYIDYALDVPMYFYRRDGQYINVAGLSFRDFMDGKLPGHHDVYPDLNDWHDHLTTVFPEVRLKHYLELRNADSGPPEMVYAMAAFWTGLLYDRDVLEQTHDRIKDWSLSRHRNLLKDTACNGLNAVIEDGPYLSDFAAEMLCAAQKGLSVIDKTGGDIPWLDPLFSRLSAHNAKTDQEQNKTICS
ncbi:MAG: glutamate--cysteine ligase [Pseudomonadota bacterium]